jgi:DNA-binding transcriptional LysR family regulator
LVEGPVDHPSVDVVPWRNDELVVIAPPDHPLLERAGVDADTIAREPFLVREPGSGTREVGERALALHGIRLMNTMRVGGTEAIKQAVAAGLGLAIVSRAAATDQLALGRIAILHVEGLVIHRSLAQLRLHDRAPTAAGKELELLLAEGTG